MKKIYFSLLFVLSFISQSHSQFAESFEGSTLPDLTTGQWSLASGNWDVSDNGVGLLNSWTVNNGVSVPPMVHDGANAAYMNRENIGAGNTSEDWLVTPAVMVGPGHSLNFFTRSTIFGNQGTSYEIRISTTSQTDHAAFSPLAAWTEDDLNVTFNLFEQKTVSLSAFEWQTVYIAFVMRFTQPDAALSGDRWIVDKVSVSEPAQPFNIINGTVSYGDTLLECSPENGVNGSYLTTGNADDMMYNLSQSGLYAIHSHETEVTITGNDPNSYFTFTPPSYTFNFTDFGNTETANFCMTPNGIHPDLEITLHSAGAIPGGTPHYYLVYKNIGTQTQSGSINFTFNDAVMDYVSSLPLQPSSQTENNLTYSFADLQPFESRNLTINFQLNTPMDVPPLNLGDVLSFNVSIGSPLIDETLQNNFAQLQQTVVSSFDPNDKIVLEGATITPQEIGNYLHYVIRFQNTGNAPAQRVVVRDYLEENLDPTTLQVLGGSHPFVTSKNGNLIEFTFENINLPPVSTDESGSNGFVIFKIKPINTVGLGSVIANHANIYFDFNFPITTNDAITTVTALGTSNPGMDAFTMYPNPAKNEVRFNADGTAIHTVLIYNMLGQLVKTVSGQSGNPVLDVSDLNSGSYLVTIISNKGKTSKRLLKI